MKYQIHYSVSVILLKLLRLFRKQISRKQSINAPHLLVGAQLEMYRDTVCDSQYKINTNGKTCPYSQSLSEQALKVGFRYLMTHEINQNDLFVLNLEFQTHLLNIYSILSCASIDN